MTAADDRRFRPLRELEPLELKPLIGADASLVQLKEAGVSLRGGYALERLVDQRWQVVGYAGTEEAAQDWIDGPDVPDGPPLKAFDVTVRVIDEPGLTRDQVMTAVSNAVRPWASIDLRVREVILEPHEARFHREAEKILRRELGDD